MRSGFFAIPFLFGLLPYDCPATDLFWTNYHSSNGSISRADISDFVVHPIIPTGLSGAYRIAVSQSLQKVYWTSPNANATGGLWRCNLDGSAVEQILAYGSNGGGRFAALTIDESTEAIFWSQSSRILSANLDGSSIQVFQGQGNSFVQDIAIDSAAGRAYFSDYSGGAFGRLRAMDTDGTDLVTLVPSVGVGPTGIGLDPVNRHVFFGSLNGGSATARLERVDMDGANRQNIIFGVDVDSIAMDLPNNKIYWTDYENFGTDGRIRRANLDGTGVETLFSGFTPGGITIVPEPMTLAMILCACFAVRLRRVCVR